MPTVYLSFNYSESGQGLYAANYINYAFTSFGQIARPFLAARLASAFRKKLEANDGKYLEGRKEQYVLQLERLEKGLAECELIHAPVWLPGGRKLISCCLFVTNSLSLIMHRPR